MTELEERLHKAEWVLENCGFRRCDIPACNCNSWHQVGGFYARFQEIKEVVEEAGYSTNSRILLDVVKEIVAAAPGRCDAEVTEVMCKAAINADEQDRIQGCSYQERHVIYDTWLPREAQEIWSAPVAGPDEYQAFQRQCSLERMRKVLEAALSVSSADRGGGA